VLVQVSPAYQIACVLVIPSCISKDTDGRVLIIQYSLSHNPFEWGLDLSPNHQEDDDALHMPTVDLDSDRRISKFSKRGIGNCGCLLVVLAGIVVLL